MVMLSNSLAQHAQSNAADVTWRARGATTCLAKASDAVLAGRGCCFTFHRAVTTAQWAHQPNRGFHIDVGYLERLLVHLRQTDWDIITLDEALMRSAQPHARKFVNFSVDDCYRDTAETVVPLFRALNAPVTLFVTTGIPDATLRLRDAGLETILLNEQQVSEQGQSFVCSTETEKRAAYDSISRAWDAAPNRDERYAEFCERHGYDVDELDDQHRISWSMIKEIAEDPLVEIGGHTVSHRRISTLEDHDATAELAECRARLETMVGRTIRHFAFPFGRAGDCGPRDFDLARQTGFVSASTTRKGLIGPSTDPFRLPRNTLNGVHRNLRFAYAHLTGISGLATGLMRRG